MRPQYIYDALLMPEVGGDEIAVLENGYETVLDSKKHRVEQPNYALAVIRKGPQGWYLSRKIEFSRTTCFRTGKRSMTSRKRRDRRPLPGLQGLRGNYIPSTIEIDGHGRIRHHPEHGPSWKSIER